MKVSLKSLGCPKNLVDSEHLLGTLLASNYQYTDNWEEAEVIIINTCCFIQDATTEAIDTIFEAVQYKKQGNCRLVVVTGCLAQRYPQQLFEELVEVDAFIGVRDYHRLVEVIKEALDGKRVLCVSENTDNSYLEKLPRIQGTSPHYAYLRIADGCFHQCSFCVIPQIRGSYQSRPWELIVEEAKNLAQNGVKELILIAQDTGCYGIDLYGEKKLCFLLEKLTKIEGIKWLRLMYVAPFSLDDLLLDLIAKEEKICKYIDLPIQHVSQKILAKMNRSGDKKSLGNLIQKIRKKIPDVTLRTSLIVGFPSESSEDFQELLSAVEEFSFDRLGVFTYSQEEGTPACSYPDQINSKTKKQRKKQILQKQGEISYRKNMSLVGKEIVVLVDSLPKKKVLVGRTEGDAPEIDGLVYIYGNTAQIKTGDFVKATVTKASVYDLRGKINADNRKR